MTVRKSLAMGLVVVFLPAAVWAQYVYQEHYQWRNDDGSESAASWKANADTAITGVTRGTNIRLRFAEVNKYTGSYAFQVAARLEYSTSTTGPWTPVSTASDGTAAFEMATTSGYADGDSTTAQLAGAGTFVAGKCVESPNNTSANVAINLSQYSNFEYCFKATAKARASTTYYFRMALSSNPSYQGYTLYAQLTMAAGEANEAPVIKSPLTAQGSVVAAFSYAILASGSEPIAYRAGGLPAGLAFDGTNRITGTPASVGTYSVGLTATNAWGGDAKTLALTVFANQPPVASNQTANVVEAGEVLIYLAWGDPDTPLRTDHTFTILSGPSQGTLQSYNARNNTTAYPDYWYYRAAVGTGTQSFTWKCRDKDNDSNVATCTINVTANTAPAAKDTSATVSGGLRTQVYLSASHSDAGQTLTYTLVSGPGHGTLEPNPTSSYWYYTPASGYVGWDSFTWRCNDGKDDSNVATVTINVGMSAPVPQNQTVCVAKNVAKIFPAAYTGGGGYTCEVVKVSGPGWGIGSTVTVTNGTSFRYVPGANYTGFDSFTWKMNYWNATTPSTGTVTVTCSILVKESVADWPTFRADSLRSGMTAADPPQNLRLQWVRTLPLARQAWPGAGANQVWPGARNSQGYFNTTVGVYMGIDFNYEPIAADGKVFIGSNRDDCLAAYDAATGAELWRAYTGGPIRQAPVYYNGKVYAGSDDSFIYCWNANTGALIWKRQAVSGTGDGASLLSRKKVFGNLRMISPWCVRGGLMMHAGVLYFASGLWPIEGTFQGALNPDTGKTLWMNGGGFNTPQGYLVLSTGAWNIPATGYFYVPGGKSPPMVLPLYTGQVGGESVGGPASDLASGLAIGSNSLEPDDGVAPLGAGPKSGYSWVVFHDNQGTSLDQWPSAITVGSKTYSATDVTALGVVGTVWRIIAANGRLFALTEGSATVNPQLYCFGGDEQSSPPTWPVNVTSLPSPNDVWKTRATRILSESGVNDRGVALVLGIGSGRLVDELLLQSSLHVVAIDPDTNKVQALHKKLSDAGLYGVRGSVVCGEPMSSGLPPYVGRLIVSEDISTAGWSNGVSFVQGLFRCVRPYDGKAWLFTTGGEHTSFSGWAASAGLENATVARDSGNEFSVLTRVGALPGVVEWTAANGAITNVDQAVRGRLGVLWYGDTSSDIAGASYITTSPPDLTQGRIVAGTGRSVDTYSGTVLTGTRTYSGGKSIGAVNVGPLEHSDGQRLNPLFGLREPKGYPNWGGVNCAASGTSFGRIRVGGAVYAHDIGLIVMPFKVSCGNGNGNGIAANGLVMYPQQQGCACERTPQTSLALVHDPDPEYWVENFCSYAWHRIAHTVEEAPMMHLGVNFGAPGEHMNTNGMLWVRENGVYSTPYEPATAQRYYNHSVQMVSSEGPKWVAASGLKGATKIRVPVAWTPVAQWADTSPVIDGNLSDACWDGASPTLLNRAGTGSGNSWFRYDGTNLYIGAVVPNPGSPAGEGVRGWTVHVSDRAQVTSGGVTKGFWLNIDQNGTKSGGVQAGYGTISPWAGVGSGAMIWSGTTNCTVEYAIPWTTLAAEGFEREKLIINVIGPQYAQIRGDGNYGYGYGYDNRQGFYVPLRFDQVTGFMGSPRPYNVRLHFAETEGALAGKRVFDVKLQGNTVLSNFDVFTAAGGPDRGIVREFAGVSVGNELVVEFTPKMGDPVISGVELNAEFALPNQAPILGVRNGYTENPAYHPYLTDATVEPEGDNVAYTWELDGTSAGTGGSWSCNTATMSLGDHRIKVTANDGRGGVSSQEWMIQATGSNSLPDVAVTASPTVGTPGMTVSFDASGSVDTNGSIVGYSWDFSDPPSSNGYGTAGGPTTNHTFAQAGSYNVRVTVTDNEGAKRSATAMIYAIPPAAPRITSALTASPTVGKSFSYTIIATGPTPITYGASGLPAGLSLTGPTISGTPTTAGSNNVTLTANNAYGTDTRTLALVTYMNRAPVAGNDSATALKGMPVVIAVLANDSDLDADALTVISVIQPGHGTVVNNLSNLTYTSYSSYSGPDNFTYTVSDGHGGVATGTVSVTVNDMAPGLLYEYYHGTWGSGGYLPDFDSLTAVTNGMVGTFNIAPRLRDTDFAFRFTGKIQIATGGSYTFTTSSDDGSKLYVDGSQIVNNDGPHGIVEQSGTTYLEAGFHDIAVTFCQGGGGFGLTVSWQGPGIGKAEIPSNVLFRTAVAGIGDLNANGMPDAWEVANFGSTNAVNGGPLEDWDHDGMCNLAEYIAGTCPTNAGSRFQVSGVRCQGGDFYLRFLTETGRSYGVVGRSDWVGTSQWVIVTNGMPGTGGYLEVRDPVTGAKRFYRVMVRLE